MRAYFFLIIIAITLSQVCFFILTWVEIYPGITYPAFAKQLNIIKLHIPLPRCFTGEDYKNIYTIWDYCIRGFMNPKYKKISMELSLRDNKWYKINIKAEDLLPYIKFHWQKEHLQDRMLDAGYWWTKDSKTYSNYNLNKEKLWNIILQCARKFPKLDTNNGIYLDVKFTQNTILVLSYSLSIF